MSNITPGSGFPEVPAWDNTTDASGAVMNESLLALATRTATLKSSVEAVAAGQVNGVFGYALKSEMDADLAHAAGALAVVTNDPTVENNGSYRKSGASGAGSWVAAVDRTAAVKLTADSAMARVGDMNRQSGFKNAGITGFNAANGGGNSSLVWSIDAVDGSITMSPITAGVYLASPGLPRPKFVATEYEVVGEIVTASGSSGPLIAFGDDTSGTGSRRICAYLSNGYVGVMNNAGTTLLGGVVAGMSFSAGQKASIRVIVRDDGTGYIEATSPTGAKATLDIASIPVGSVRTGWRNAGTGKAYGLIATPVAASMSRVGSRLAALEGISTSPHTWKVLPDSVAGRSVPGITCTGLARAVGNGKFRGCWIIGDDGRLVEGDGSPFVPRIHILDPDCSRILATIDPGYSGASLQGVTTDTLATNETVWVACGDGTIRNFNLYGVSAMQEIASDRITLSSIGVSGGPGNALAFDATAGTGRGALWVGTSAGTAVYLIDCNPSATVRIIRSITLANNPDHFQLVGRNLLYQWGPNATRARINKFDLDAGTEASWAGPLELCMAPEGFFYDALTGFLTILSDNGYHVSAWSGPAFNIIMKFRVLAP